MLVASPAVNPDAVPVMFVPTNVVGVPRAEPDGIVTVPVNVGDANGAYVVLVYALLPSVPPVPMFNVDPSVPARVIVLDIVRVFEVVPPAIWKPMAFAVRVRPLTDVGVMAPNPIVKAGVVVAVAHVAVTPLLAAAVETEVTVPVPSVPEVGNVMLVVPVVVNVMALAPEVVRLPPRVIVELPLLTPVPPLALGRTPVTSAVKLTADHDGSPDAFP